MYLACQECNWTKGTAFPIASDRAKPKCHGEELRAETRLLLDPCADPPETHLRFLETGEVIALNESEKGRTSIEIYDLNRQELVQARREQAQNLMRLIERTSGRDRAALLDKECRHNKAFCGMRKQIAALYRNEDRLAKPQSKYGLTRIRSSARVAWAKSTWPGIFGLDADKSW